MKNLLVLFLVFASAGCSFDLSSLGPRDAGTADVPLGDVELPDGGTPDDVPVLADVDAPTDDTGSDIPDVPEDAPADVPTGDAPLFCTDAPDISGEFQSRFPATGCYYQALGSFRITISHTGDCAWGVVSSLLDDSFTGDCNSEVLPDGTFRYACVLGGDRRSMCDFSLTPSGDLDMICVERTSMLVLCETTFPAI